MRKLGTIIQNPKSTRFKGKKWGEKENEYVQFQRGKNKNIMSNYDDHFNTYPKPSNGVGIFILLFY